MAAARPSSRPPASRAKLSAVDENLRAALAWVAAQPEPCRLTVGELIRNAGLSRATLYRAFQLLGGVNEFLMSVRLRAAEELLASGLSCKEVSRRCGFRGQAHFSKRFAAAHGVTAKTYAASACALRHLAGRPENEGGPP